MSESIEELETLIGEDLCLVNESLRGLESRLESYQAQVAALTEQRDALLAACRAAGQLPRLVREYAEAVAANAEFSIETPRAKQARENLESVRCQLAAAIAQVEPKA